MRRRDEAGTTIVILAQIMAQREPEIGSLIRLTRTLKDSLKGSG
jgi:hypothetical protein